MTTLAHHPQAYSRLRDYFAYQDMNAPILKGHDRRIARARDPGFQAYCDSRGDNPTWKQILCALMLIEQGEKTYDPWQPYPDSHLKPRGPYRTQQRAGTGGFYFLLNGHAVGPYKSEVQALRARGMRSGHWHHCVRCGLKSLKNPCVPREELA